MSTTAIVLIVIAAIVVIGVVLYFGKQRREAQLEERRVEAGERRDLADTKAREAEQARLAAEEQAERARAREAEAESHRREADELDPDVDVRRRPDDVDERARTGSRRIALFSVGREALRLGAGGRPALRRLPRR